MTEHLENISSLWENEKPAQPATAEEICSLCLERINNMTSDLSGDKKCVELIVLPRSWAEL